MHLRFCSNQRADSAYFPLPFPLPLSIPERPFVTAAVASSVRAALSPPRPAPARLSSPLRPNLPRQKPLRGAVGLFPQTGSPAPQGFQRAVALWRGAGAAPLRSLGYGGAHRACCGRKKGRSFLGSALWRGSIGVNLCWLIRRWERASGKRRFPASPRWQP